MSAQITIKKKRNGYYHISVNGTLIYEIVRMYHNTDPRWHLVDLKTGNVLGVFRSKVQAVAAIQVDPQEDTDEDVTWTTVSDREYAAYVDGVLAYRVVEDGGNWSVVGHDGMVIAIDPDRSSAMKVVNWMIQDNDTAY